MTPEQKANLLAFIQALEAVAVTAPPPPPPAPPPPAPPPPVPAPPPPSPPPVPVGEAIYFSQTGSNTNDGSLANPKRDLAGFNINAHDPAIALRFQRGNTFQMPRLTLRNGRASASQRLTFEAYGVGEKPILQWPDYSNPNPNSPYAAVEFGLSFSDQVSHSGYLFRDLNLSITGTGNSWAFWCKGNVTDVRVEDCALTGWYMGLEGQAGHNATRIEVLRNTFPGNRGMCIHGCYFDLTAEDNDFSDAIAQANHLVHRIYVRNGDRYIFRRNRFVTDRPCQGGTYTVHGYIPTFTVFEDNVAMYGPGSEEGAWLISFIPDAPAGTVGGFNGVVVRGNTVQNGGNNAIHVECAPGAVLEDNLIILTQARTQVAIAHRNDTELPINLSGACTMRNNRAVGPGGSLFSYGAAPGSVMENNTTEVA